MKMSVPQGTTDGVLILILRLNVAQHLGLGIQQQSIRHILRATRSGRNYQPVRWPVSRGNPHTRGTVYPHLCTAYTQTGTGGPPYDYTNWYYTWSFPFSPTNFQWNAESDYVKIICSISGSHYLSTPFPVGTGGAMQVEFATSYTSLPSGWTTCATEPTCGPTWQPLTLQCNPGSRFLCLHPRISMRTTERTSLKFNKWPLATDRAAHLRGAALDPVRTRGRPVFLIHSPLLPDQHRRDCALTILSYFRREYTASWCLFVNFRSSVQH